MFCLMLRVWGTTVRYGSTLPSPMSFYCRLLSHMYAAAMAICTCTIIIVMLGHTLCVCTTHLIWPLVRGLGYRNCFSFLSWVIEAEMHNTYNKMAYHGLYNTGRTAWIKESSRVNTWCMYSLISPSAFGEGLECHCEVKHIMDSLHRNFIAWEICGSYEFYVGEN